MNDRMELIERLSRSSILSVFEAASKMLEDDRDLDLEPVQEAYQEDLTMSGEDEYENWEGMPMCEGFDAFEVDPDDALEGMKMGIPKNQLLVSSPYQGMLKAAPMFAQIFRIEE